MKLTDRIAEYNSYSLFKSQIVRYPHFKSSVKPIRMLIISVGMWAIYCLSFGYEAVKYEEVM
jgi:hypothetical protein